MKFGDETPEAKLLVVKVPGGTYRWKELNPSQMLFPEHFGQLLRFVGASSCKLHFALTQTVQIELTPKSGCWTLVLVCLHPAPMVNPVGRLSRIH